MMTPEEIAREHEEAQFQLGYAFDSKSKRYWRKRRDRFARKLAKLRKKGAI